MLQTIAGKLVYVVEFDTMPELPIVGLTEQEKGYTSILKRLVGNLNGLLATATGLTDSKYAQVLTAAIISGVITEPGKYGLYIDHKTQNWEAFKIIE